MSFQPYMIAPLSKGLVRNKKPFLLMDNAFQTLNNAYCFRERIKRREGIKYVSRLRRTFSVASIGNSSASPWTLNIFSFQGVKGSITAISNANPGEVTTLDDHNLSNGDQVIISEVGGMTQVNDTTFTITVTATDRFTIGVNTLAYGVYTTGGFWTLATQPNAQIEPGSVIITIQAGPDIVFTDQGDGQLTSPTAGNFGYIDYWTGEIVLTHTAGAGVATTATWNYYPGLPVMGIHQREIAGVNLEQTAIWDTVYVYDYDGDFFNEASTTTWSGSNSDFFWTENVRGSDPNVRLFFATNNYIDTATPLNDPIRYTQDLLNWTDFAPFTNVANTTQIWQTRLIIYYYGRVLFLNTWEGVDVANSVNYFNRCRFSQIGNPLETEAWYSDEFGRGGFIDAPTNESIVSARFYKNTLIVQFERSTWQLRYVGEYGLPFLWERISSDFGSESTFSTILFDQGVLAIGDKAIVSSSGNDVQRIDLEIPDTVFDFQNINAGKERVHGVRDFQKEIVYWTYATGNTESTYPNRVLVYNYRNNTWAIYRDNVTAFGVLQTAVGVSWDEAISWDSDTPWASSYSEEFPAVISGNQQGYIHFYQYSTDLENSADDETGLRENLSLYVKSITLNASDPIRIESPDHNLENGEFIYLTGLNFIDTTPTATEYPIVTTDLNNKIYKVEVFDDDNIDLYQWVSDDEIYIKTSHDLTNYTPAPGDGTYVGGGEMILLQNMSIITKDFNPYQDNGSKLKSSYTDFQVDANPNAQISILIYCDSALTNAVNTSLYNPNTPTDANLIGQIEDITINGDNNPVVTSFSHGLSTGRKITVGYVNGMTEINNLGSSVTVVDLNTFTLPDIDATGFTTYTNGGTWSTTDSNFYYVTGGSYYWHRFYSNVFGQYITFQITYNDTLMNNIVTHSTDFELNAMTLYTKPAGRFA